MPMQFNTTFFHLAGGQGGSGFNKWTSLGEAIGTCDCMIQHSVFLKMFANTQFCTIILKTAVRFPNHCGLNFAGIWKVADRVKGNLLKWRTHLTCLIVPGSGLWAYLSHRPSLLVEKVGEYLFLSPGLPPTPGQYKHHHSVLQKLLIQI